MNNLEPPKKHVWTVWGDITCMFKENMETTHRKAPTSPLVWTNDCRKVVVFYSHWFEPGNLLLNNTQLLWTSCYIHYSSLRDISMIWNWNHFSYNLIKTFNFFKCLIDLRISKTDHISYERLTESVGTGQNIQGWSGITKFIHQQKWMHWMETSRETSRRTKRVTELRTICSSGSTLDAFCLFVSTKHLKLD